MKRIKGLPRPANPDDTVAIDLEVLKPEDRAHRPSGLFACTTFCFGDETYMITDKQDLPEALDRVSPASWVLQKATYDLRQFKRWAPIDRRPIWDTMLIEQDLFAGYYNRFGLDALARRWLKVKAPKDVRDEFLTRESMTKEMEDYSFQDAELTWRVAQAQSKYIEETYEEMRHYWEIDEPMIWVVLDMPAPKVDVDTWAKASARFKEKSTEIEEELGINVKSVPQKRELLTDLTGRDWSDESTAQDILEGLIEKHQGTDIADTVARLVEGIQYRDMSDKRYGIEGWQRFLEDDDRIYTDWKISRASTGRMASGEPNLQNIPVRGFPIFRSFFIPSPGNLMGTWDVSQQEPRILAHYSRDKRLLEAIRAGEDLHQAAADGMVKVLGPSHSFSKLSREERRRIGKTINLGSSYGLSRYGLSNKLSITEAEAETFLDAYFQRFMGVKMWMGRMRSKAYKMGYIRTVAGRRSWINPYDYKWRNNAINAPIQGTAADHTKLAVVYNWRMAQSMGLPFAVCMIVHDEFIQDFPAGLRDQYSWLAERSWKEAWYDLIPDIPVEVDGGVGPTWLEAKKNADE